MVQNEQITNLVKYEKFKNCFLQLGDNCENADAAAVAQLNAVGAIIVVSISPVRQDHQSSLQSKCAYIKTDCLCETYICKSSFANSPVRMQTLVLAISMDALTQSTKCVLRVSCSCQIVR